MRGQRIQRAVSVCRKRSVFFLLMEKKGELAAAEEELELPKLRPITEAPAVQALAMQ